MNTQQIDQQLAALDAEETALTARIAALEAAQATDDARVLEYAAAPLKFRQIINRRADLEKQRFEAEQAERAAVVEAQRRELADVRAQRVKLEKQQAKKAAAYLRSAQDYASAIQRESALCTALGEALDPVFVRSVELTSCSLRLVSALDELSAIKPPSLALLDKARAWASAGLDTDAATELESIFQHIYRGDLAEHRRQSIEALAGEVIRTAQQVVKATPQSNGGFVPAVRRDMLLQRGVSQAQLNATLAQARALAYKAAHPEAVEPPEPEPIVEAAPTQRVLTRCNTCGQPIFSIAPGIAVCPRCGSFLK